MAYKGLKRVTRGYRVLQGLKQLLKGVLSSYKGLLGITGLQTVTEGYKGLQRVTRGYR